ncbi:type VII secretion protein EccB [Saccharopolyspora subtropica]|uniref:Type VII secretion protein EccB n=1 Tax=Saccharopolyspora thermophila TaxID=89367 RepID=A0A917K6R7_9PSEU|nr:type VII secretion protein EccB [Saccharopolyspora subtropica]GGJ03111.1 type VII secretion protein EccB [Saccharopolyspora subtropica]
MQTQRDHVHAYQFLMGRMSSALVLNDPASAEVPSRRAITGAIIGLVLALLISVGFGVFGFIFPGGNKSWQAEGAIVVEKETGTRYINVNGVLHPTLNYASAVLRQGAGAKVSLVSRASLRDAPRGAPMGIPGAPQSLPSAQDIVGAHWLFCLSGGNDFTLDFDPDTPAATLPTDRYALVESPTATQYVVWGGAKHRVAHPVVTAALGMAGEQPIRAPQQWLDALPDGPELAPAVINGAGSNGPVVGGQARQVGQLFEYHAANGDVELFVLRRDGLAPVSRTEFTLLDAMAGSPDPVRIDAAAVAAAPRSADRSLTRRLPDLSQARRLDRAAESLCLRQTPVGAQVRSEVVLAPQSPQGGVVRMPPGTGVVAAAVPVPAGRRTPDRYLITGGTKYLIPDDDSIRALGYGSVPVRPISTELLAALPSGPDLSRAAMGVTGRG